jgi:transcriptional regulator with XRE-family HTH domain
MSHRPAPRLVRLLRERLGISQAELARQMGVSQSALCQLEHGRESALSPARVRPVVDAMMGRIRDMEGQ